MGNPKEWKSLGLHGYTAAKEHFSKEEYYKKIMRLYTDLIEKRHLD